MPLARTLVILALALVATVGMAFSPTVVRAAQRHPAHPPAPSAPTLVADLEPGVIPSGDSPSASQSPSPPRFEDPPQPPRAAAPEPPPPPPAPVSWSGGGGGGGGGGVGSTQHALINADRAAAGLPPLAWSGCLAGVAGAQAARMAQQGAIFHGPLGQCGVPAGENVGFWSGGINDGQLNSMFMGSGGHRANIMGPYRYVGTAWAVAPDGKAYIAVEFG